ncbi:BON domain-containing protein [Azohydromonas australica]|uniref:BON domain-containing protein n=1 Tax=Azohydromonas australica TaxID=364039 RepID=UPI00041C17D5|nr:BON domain-containing protein [Azohydromonas australica]
MSKLSRNWIEGGLRAARVAAVLGAAAWFSGCAPLLVGGAAMGGAMVFSDRRTSGTQVEDQSIEVKAANRAREVLGEQGHVNFTSYNRTLLVTGEVPSEADRTGVERAVSGIENLRAVVNELGVLGNSALTSRSSDAIITSKVKATFVDAKDLHSNAFKVVTERGTVYLMGRVTEREATRATELARSVGGVEKVVRVFEILTESELANLQTAK